MIDTERYAQDLSKLRETVEKAADALHLPQLEEELTELKEEMNEPEFWNDLQRSTAVNRKVGQIEGKINHVARLRSRADDIEAMLMLLNEEPDEEMGAECEKELADLTADADALELETMMRGEYDSCNAVLSLHAGAGGTEAQDWTSMLYRMYTRYCERHGFKVTVNDILEGDEAGLKSVTFQVEGENAYGFLRSERGVHRLVRISPFDANARRHTSFSSLDVAPILEGDQDFEVNMEEVRIDTDSEPRGLPSHSEKPPVGAQAAGTRRTDERHQGRNEKDRMGQPDSFLRVPALHHGQGSPHRL